jgi:hypothetical protein
MRLKTLSSRLKLEDLNLKFWNKKRFMYNSLPISNETMATFRPGWTDGFRPVHCIKSELYLAKWKWILRSGPKFKMLVKFHPSNGSFPNPLNWWWIRFGCTALDQCYWNKENWFANWKSTMHFSDLHIWASTMPLIIEFFIKIKSKFGRFWGQTRIIILSLP